MTFLEKIWRPLVAIFLLIILIKNGPFKVDQIQLVLSQKNILLAGFSICLLQFVLFTLRWKIFVNQISKIPFAFAFKLTLIGQFFSFFIPGGVGGDVVKALELARTKLMSRSQALSTVIADRVLGLFAMIFFSTLFLAIETRDQNSESIQRFLMSSFFLFLGITCGLLLAPFIFKKLKILVENKKSIVLQKIEKLMTSLDLTFLSFRNFKIQIFNLFLSGLIQCLSISFMYYIVLSLGVEPPPILIFFSFCCFGFVASAIPITPAGVGVGQAAFYYLFSTIDSNLGQAAVTAISVLQLFYLLFALFGGIVFAFKSKTKMRTI